MDFQINKILAGELARRCERNPRYSLRSFAQALGVSPANLSLLINGKRPASARTIVRILDRVELNEKQRAYLRHRLGLGPELTADTVNLQTAERICHWLCYAILSVALTVDFQSDEKWLAERFGVSIHEVRRSLDALVAAGLFDVSGTSWKPVKAVRINNQISTAVIRGFHRQLVDKAMASMEADPMEVRDISSITFAMSSELVAKAKEEIREFRLRMAELFEQPGQSTEVYNLTVQLVPATRRKNAKVSADRSVSDSRRLSGQKRRGRK